MILSAKSGIFMEKMNGVKGEALVQDVCTLYQEILRFFFCLYGCLIC